MCSAKSSAAGRNCADHYCFFERVKQKEGEVEKDYLYNVEKQELHIRDLKRYGIQAILLDSHSEITAILRKIEHSYLLKNVFISSSDFQ